ncbi:MAG: helix-turn-helix domain-containing protein [Aggregatilineales bacterium]
MTNFSDLGFDCWYGEPSLMNTPHRHNEVEINFVEQGAMHYWLGEGSIELPRQTLVIFWATIPHQLIYTEPETRFYWVTIPLNWFLRWRLPPLLTDSVLNGAWLFDNSPDNRVLDATLFPRWRDDFASQESDHQAVMLMEIEARLARLALSVGAVSTQKNTMSNSHAEAMSAWIAGHYQEAIGVDDIAQSVGLHPNYAMRIFRQAFGRSMGDVLTQHRLAHAQRLLVTTQESVLEIALAVGFGSLSRFYAVFKARCGQSPKAYREKMGILPE